MRVLIFEGIATSGKTTVIDGLRKRLTEGRVIVYSEQVTHVPIMNDRDRLHAGFFKELISRAIAEHADVAIFDRLYMTQAYRARAKVADYAEVEESLRREVALTVFLEVDEAAIAPRLKAAMQHRDPEWAQYVRGKGESIESVALQYAEQQRAMRQFADASTLPSRIFNTTHHDYDAVVDALL